MLRLNPGTSAVGAVRILGIVAKTHDSGVALLNDGVPEFVCEEERFDRIKKSKKFPKRGARRSPRRAETWPRGHRRHHHAVGRAAAAALVPENRAGPLAAQPRFRAFAQPRGPAEPDRHPQSLSPERGLRALGRSENLPPIVNVPPPRRARRHVLRLAVRGGAGTGDGRLRRRRLQQRLRRSRQPAGAALVDDHHEFRWASSTRSSPNTWGLPASATKAR